MMKNVISNCLVLTLLCVFCVSPSIARKKWTITQRQATLDREINAGQKSGELTLKEATKLRSYSEKIQNSIDEMKQKNGGKLSYSDENVIEKRLNKLSNSIHKKELEKRVEH